MSLSFTLHFPLNHTNHNLLEVGMHWFPEGGGGGSDRYFHGLVTQMQRLDLSFRAVAFSEVAEGGVEVVNLERLGSRTLGGVERLKRIRAAARRFISKQPGTTVIATHFALYAFPLLDLFWKHPHVVHFHGPWSDESAAEGGSAMNVFVKRRIERMVYSSARRFIVLSEAFAGLLVDRFSVAREKIVVIPGGIDAERFRVDASRQQARERLGWPQDRRIILCVRRLVRRMGLEELIDAMDVVRRRYPDALLVMAGTGHSEQGLSAKVAAAGLGDHVRLVGFVPDSDLPWAYRAADLSIVPSQSLEGFGLITLESLAAGTPVLVTPVGGLPEAVSGLSRSLVLPGAATQDLATGLVEFFAGNLRLPDEKECMDYVSAHFDWSRIALRVLQVYQESVRPPHHGTITA